MGDFIIRKASINDIPFLIDTIISAEKSGTEHIGLARIFELTESKLRDYLFQALEEEIDGCEFSVSSFIVADYEGKPVSAFGGWIEGVNEDELPSAILKSNLIGYIFPKENVLASKQKSAIVKSLQIEREKNTYQLEYSFTLPEYRGNGLIGQIIDEHIRVAKDACVQKMQVHVFDNNQCAIHAYEKKGFAISRVYKSENPMTEEFFPSDVELLMEKEL